jgi:hypothetical protein
MKHNLALTVMSLLTILLSSFHLSDDMVLGLEPGGVSNYNGILIMAVFLYATMSLGERRLPHVVVLIGSVGAAAVPYLHMTGVGLVGGRAANATGKFFWVWTLMALGVTALMSAVLSAHGLWRIGWRRTDASRRGGLAAAASACPQGDVDYPH